MPIKVAGRTSTNGVAQTGGCGWESGQQRGGAQRSWCPFLLLLFFWACKRKVMGRVKVKSPDLFQNRGSFISVNSL